jgi:hypothetical protein
VATRATVGYLSRTVLRGVTVLLGCQLCSLAAGYQHFGTAYRSHVLILLDP